VKLPYHLTMKNGHLHISGEDWITPAMEKPAWQK
jgi:hypothetical protein